MMDCDRCRERCRADCCRGMVPMTMEFIESHVPARKIEGIAELDTGHGGHTDDPERFCPVAVEVVDGKNMGVCAFLGLDDRCSIYGDRPFVCRKFGDETSEFMTCSWQDKDGRIRSRQERRRIEKVTFVRRMRMLERIRAGTATAEEMEFARQHAKEWRKEREEFERTQKGKFGISGISG